VFGQANQSERTAVVESEVVLTEQQRQQSEDALLRMGYLHSEDTAKRLTALQYYKAVLLNGEFYLIFSLCRAVNA